MTRDPLGVMLKLARLFGALMLVVVNLTSRHLLLDGNAILIAFLVVSFVTERPLRDRIPPLWGPDESPDSLVESSRGTFQNIYFAIVTGGMRLVGVLFVVVSGLLLWQSVRGPFQMSGEVATPLQTAGLVLMCVAVIALGVLLALGRHVPLMRGLREAGERARRTGAR